MLTSRAWWFLCISLLVLLFGLTIGSPALTLVPLTLLFWFGGEWLLFAVRIPLAVRRLRVLREVYDERGPVATLWAGRPFEVGLRLEAGGRLPLPYVALDDRPPFAVEYLGGPLAADGPVGGGDGLEIRYHVRCRGPGLARFEGVRVQVADFQGFFIHTAFVPGVAVYRVLPVLAEGRDPTPTLKRDNQLPPPGVHRLRRPGSASELLDLRDYMPGDPPKTIAWKVSARRDRLVTKEFESEAPVRCTLFVDASNSVRVPSVHGKALGRLVEIAAAVLQANADVRDLTGLCLFDEHDSKTIRPDRSPAHVTQVLQTLADAAALAPATARIDPDHLIPVAYAFAREVYPHLMRPAVNAVPFWQEWFDSFPGYTRRKFSLIHYLFRRKRALLLTGHVGDPARPAGGRRPASRGSSPWRCRAEPVCNCSRPSAFSTLVLRRLAVFCSCDPVPAIHRPPPPPRPLPQAARRPAVGALRPGAGRPVGAAGGRRRLRPAGPALPRRTPRPVHPAALRPRRPLPLRRRRARSRCWRRPCCGPSARAATTSCSCCWPTCWSWTTPSTRCSRRCAWP